MLLKINCVIYNCFTGFCKVTFYRWHLTLIGILCVTGDNGTLHFWDWKTGYNFQRFQAPVQPGSIDSEAGIFAMTFDQSGSRLLTAEADKTIKIYKEDESAVSYCFRFHCIISPRFSVEGRRCLPFPSVQKHCFYFPLISWYSCIIWSPHRAPVYQ